MLRVPDYFENFHCLAGACPHSCCEGWDVVLDEETVERYRAVSGPLGEKLRAAKTEEAGEACFALRGGRCPFLDGENLCEIHKALGQEATSETCQSHPRFTEEYGDLLEITLSASCPAANDLLLGASSPLRFVTAEEGGEVLPEAAALFALRESALALLQDRSRSLKSRLRWLLVLAAQAQPAVEDEDDQALYDLAEAAKDLPADPGVEASGESLFPAVLEVLGELEILGADWPELLEAGKSAQGLDLEENAAALERICAYFLFRWFCKAVSDGDLLSKVQLSLLGTLTAARLGAVCGLGEALRLFSREIEHSEENLDALQEAFCFDERLAPQRFCAACQV